MASTSVDSQLGRLFGQQDMILKELSTAREDRKAHYSTVNEIKGSVLNLDNRMTHVEATLTQFSPTIDEFIELKQKVIGAGKLGKWLWVIGLGLLGVAFKFRTELVTWFGK